MVRTKARPRKYGGFRRYRRKRTRAVIGPPAVVDAGVTLAGSVLGPERKRSRGIVTRGKETLPSYVRRPNQMVEVKHAVISITHAQVASTWTFLDLTYLAQGDYDYTRDGNLINALQIELYGQYTLGTTTAGVWVRSVVFVDTENQNADPAAADVFASGNELWTLYNFSAEMAKRFVVVHDTGPKLLTDVTNHGVGVGAENQDFLRKRIPLNHVVRYNSNQADDACQGRIYLAIMSNLVAGDTAPDLTGYARLRYVDI